MATETISVIMPNYNDAEYVGSALRAVCEQSYPPKEVIIVDDGSTDNSLAIIHQMMSKYPIIQLVQNEVNRGTNYTINRGASLATGDLFYLSSSNDEALPGLFEKSVCLLEKYPQAALCCADMHFLNILDGSSYRNPPGWLSEPGYLSPLDLVKATRVSNIPHPLIYTALVRKSKLPNWLYRPELEWYADWFLVQTLALQHGCCYIPEPLALFRWLDRGYAYSGLHNPKYYREIVSRIIKLLAQPEYEDVARLMVKGRCLNFFEIHACSPFIVGKAIAEVKNSNHQTKALFWYLTLRYLQSSPKALSILCRTKAIKPLQEKLHTIKGLLKNLMDRAYARAFHEYNYRRTFIKSSLKSLRQSAVGQESEEKTEN